MRIGRPKQGAARVKPAPVDPGALPEPQTADEFVARGMVFYARKQYDSAVADLKQAVQHDPQSEDAYYALGVVYKAMQNTRDSAESFQKVVELLHANPSGTHERKEMLRRLALGHINKMTIGDWNLEKEIWVHVS